MGLVWVSDWVRACVCVCGKLEHYKVVTFTIASSTRTSSPPWCLREFQSTCRFLSLCFWFPFIGIFSHWSRFIFRKEHEWTYSYEKHFPPPLQYTSSWCRLHSRNIFSKSLCYSYFRFYLFSYSIIEFGLITFATGQWQGMYSLGLVLIFKKNIFRHLILCCTILKLRGSESLTHNEMI